MADLSKEVENHGMLALSRQLADLFNDDSFEENEQTFYGFSDGELQSLEEIKDLDISSSSSSSSETYEERPPQRFTLKVALRRRASSASSEEEEISKADEELPNHKSNSGSESEKDDNFLEKREQNIKNNRAMLAQLMADLKMMPELMRSATPSMNRPATKVRGKPRASFIEHEGPRRNPERSSRRHTRSMGNVECDLMEETRDLQQSLEDELLEVREAPKRRHQPRPSMAIPHVVRPVEEITELELDRVASSVADKVYNSVSGSTCHQCRQKTTDTKTNCRNPECRGVQGQFCGPCLRNRYGEEVKDALLDPEWYCPPCREICNCSFCRQRNGRCPTGILYPLARYHGFKDVHSYLKSLQKKVKSETENDGA